MSKRSDAAKVITVLEERRDSLEERLVAVEAEHAELDERHRHLRQRVRGRGDTSAQREYEQVRAELTDRVETLKGIADERVATAQALNAAHDDMDAILRAERIKMARTLTAEKNDLLERVAQINEQLSPVLNEMQNVRETGLRTTTRRAEHLRQMRAERDRVYAGEKRIPDRRWDQPVVPASVAPIDPNDAALMAAMETRTPIVEQARGFKVTRRASRDSEAAVAPPPLVRQA